MVTGTALVALIASLGWLMLNWRALQGLGLSFERKASFAVAWIILIGGLAFVLSRMGL